MSTLVYVINGNGHKLMPCKPAKARKLLRAGRAKIAKLSPFTIQLLWECEEHTQQVTLGIDKGSHVTGFSCVGKGQILLAGEIRHRLDVKEKMEARRSNRSNRRQRKWYRPPRFLNRGSAKRSGRLPPSIKTNVEEVIRVVRQIPLPLSSIVIEDVQVDIARLNNPQLVGSQYQDPTRLDENLRIACLMRDGYACQHCGKRSARLEAHHIVERSQGGKDTLANLLCLCDHCHHRVHEGKITLEVTGVSGYLDQIAQRTMQGKSHLYASLGALMPLSTLFGYQTATLRKARELPKAHDVDALCLATYATGELVPYDREHFYTVTFRPRGVSSCPKFDHPGHPLSRRPGSVRPASVPSVFRQVISPGAVRKSTRVGTCPLRTNDSPTTLRACSSARGPGLLLRGVPPQASPIQDVPGQGVSRFIRPAPPLVHVTKWRNSLSRTCVLFYLKLGSLSSVPGSRTRRQYHDLPRKGQGRVRYQVNQQLDGFRKGDVVRVKGKYIKQINSIYSNGYLAFPRVKGEPNQALPRDCQLLERECTIRWEKCQETRENARVR